MGISWLLARLLHIICGTFWAGGVFLIALYVLPAIRAAGPGGTTVLRELIVTRRVPQVVVAVGSVAIVSGAYLLWIDSGGFAAAWLARPQGLCYVIGALASLGVVVVGLVVNLPGAKLIGRLTAAAAARGTPLTSEEAELAKRSAARVGLGTLVATVLLAITTVAMAIARTLA